MSRGLDEELARLERAIAGGDDTPDAALRLGQLYLRAGRAREAAAALTRAVEGMPPLAHDGEGRVDVDPLRVELLELLERARGTESEETRQERLRVLLGELATRGVLDPSAHDELIRLEAALEGRVSHPETPACPACTGPVLTVPEGERHRVYGLDERDLGARGQVRCARSGRDGDLCRHTDARNLYACAGCGLVLRAWVGKQVPDPHEPPLVRPGRSRCKLCGGGVSDWRRHFLRCPRGRPADFPPCEVCGKRGFHARPLACPRCAEEVAWVPCMERAVRRR